MELGSTDFLSALVGCRVNSCTISASVNETVKFSLECPYRYENLSETKISNNEDTEPVFTFAHGKIEIPDGTEIGAVQSIEYTFNNNLGDVYEIGSRFKTDQVGTTREYNFNMTVAFNDYTKLLTYFMNGTSTASNPTSGSGTEIATMTLTFENEDGDSLVFNFTNVQLNTETLPQNPNELVKEDVTGWARGCTDVVYTNDIETAPTEADNI
ncbi:MAG: phage tail tube protein [Atribacterota bacterium]